MCDISIIVATYNSSIDKLYRTLKSIILQENIGFEIIIADDGSDIYEENKIKDFFSKYHFNNYSLLHHEKNIGTVKNIYNAIKCAKSDFIKLISPGDYLYSNNILYEWMEFIRINNIQMCFSKIVPYYEDENGNLIIDTKFCKPKNDFIYQKKYRKNSTIINMCLISNTPVGAAYIIKKDLCEKYFGLIENRIIYTEDFAYRLMIIDEVKIAYYQNNAIWYEVGTGISTSRSNVWNARIKKDEEALYEIIIKRENDVSNEHFIKLIKCREKNYYKALKIFFYPEYIFWVLLSKCKSHCYSIPIDRTFFEVIKD